MFVIFASSGMIFLICSSAFSVSASIVGSGLMATLRRSVCASWRTRSLLWANSSRFLVYMTITGPSKSTSVTSMCEGMVFLTASLASSRIFSMPICSLN